MNIFKSIKWRLQIWYGLMLVVVLAGFGFTAYRLESNRQFRRIDDELHRRFGFLANALRRPPPPGPEADVLPFDRPPREPIRPGRNNPRHPVQFHLPPEAAGLFDASDPNGFYFVISRDGNEIARSTNAPSQENIGFSDVSLIIKENKMQPLPEMQKSPRYNGDFQATADLGLPRPVGQPEPAWMRGSFREVLTITPSEEWILIGKNVAPELNELRFIALELVGVGAGILLLGLIVGSRLVSSSIKPIEQISSTAPNISAACWT